MLNASFIFILNLQQYEINIPMGCAEELKNSMVSTSNIERMPILKFKVQKIHRFLNL